MSGKSHAAIGANVVWIFAAVYGYAAMGPVLFLLAVFGALLPDLDAQESKLKHWEIGWGKGRRRIAIKPFVIPWIFMAGLFKHRGFWHSLAANVLVLGASLVVAGYVHFNYMPLTLSYWLVVPAGYLTHLLADAMTRHGVPFFWPLQKNFHITPKLFWFTTGTGIDHVIFVIALLGALLLGLNIAAANGSIDVNHLLPGGSIL